MFISLFSCQECFGLATLSAEYLVIRHHFRSTSVDHMTENYFKYLREVQYKDPSNLDARASLHQRFSRNRQGLHRWIFDYLLKHADGRILELGSGPGHLWRRNLDRIPISFPIILSDLSHGMIAAARRELSTVPVHFHYAVIDAQSPPLPSNSFNIVIANHMIYHIPDIPKAIEDMHRIISRDGCLLAATNGDDHLHEIDDLVHSIDPSIIFGSRDLKDIRVIPFSMSNGREILNAAFKKVLKFKFDDELIITEVEPLVQYILSFPGNAREVFASEEKLSELKTTIAERIRKHGAFFVTKSVGLFVAIKG